jgi:hypothetical protein
MSGTVEIRGHGGRVRIEVYNYERPNAEDQDDVNWLSARCTVVVGEFSCVLRLSLVTYDFFQFLSQLERAIQRVEGTALFATPEDGIDLQITIKNTGRVELSGHARSQTSHIPEQSTLSFSFETDLSFLGQTVRELKGVVAQFPIRNVKSKGTTTST